jgi:hypothetical protein
MRIFAAGLGHLVELVFTLIVVGVIAINKMLAARREEQVPGQRAQRAPERPAQAGVNPMEPQDVDQFLDEVLGRGATAGKRVPAQEAPPVVILRPTNPPPVPQTRARPEVRRPVARTVVPRPARPARPAKVQGAPPPQPKVRSKFSESVQKDVDQAAAATLDPAALSNTGLDAEKTRQRSSVNDVIAMLRSPADIRRAILVREILGPPVALRRRRT